MAGVSLQVPALRVLGDGHVRQNQLLPSAGDSEPVGLQGMAAHSLDRLVWGRVRAERYGALA